MSGPTILGLLVLLVGGPLNLYVTVRLWRLSAAHPELKVLRERAVVATAVLIAVLIFGLIFANNDSIPPPFDLSATKLITRLAMLVVGIVPAAYWLWIYRGKE